jgi:predicted  nucleic acid-binding Zn-ribbon protein
MALKGLSQFRRALLRAYELAIALENEVKELETQIRALEARLKRAEDK